jgi:hypothetical protein
VIGSDLTWPSMSSLFIISSKLFDSNLYALPGVTWQGARTGVERSEQLIGGGKP